MTVLAEFKRTIAPIVDLLYPPRCPLCGEGIADQRGLCPSCWSELVLPSQPSCNLCQRPLRSENLDSNAICPPCLAAPPKHDGIAAATLYNDASRKLILSFKHGRKIGLAPMLGKLMAARINALLRPAEDPLLVPVPLHRIRLWQRGFNQSALLAGEMAKLGSGTISVDALRRTKPTPSLGGLGRKARARALSGAISVNPVRSSLLNGRDVVLVDDVMTSGATINACVNALKRAGAEQVIVSCFARVVDGLELH